MARQRSTSASSEGTQPTLLLISREQAQVKLQQRIEEGRGILATRIASWPELEAARTTYYTWSDVNAELLLSIFSTDRFKREYGESGFPGYLVAGLPNLGQEISDFHDNVKSSLRQLESIKQRLEYVEVAMTNDTDLGATPISHKPANKVFIVHGHDSGTKEMVARFIEKLRIEAIILHEKPNMGRTVIEKIQAYSDVRFAIVLLTPDDEGKAKNATDLLPRARQNVLLELGYFIALLGRENVCALKKGNVDVPSDILGVLYTDVDEAGHWRMELAREMKAAKLDVDLNLAI